MADSNHNREFTEVNKRLTCSLHKRERDRNLYAAKRQRNEDTRVFMKSNDVYRNRECCEKLLPFVKRDCYRIVDVYYKNSLRDRKRVVITIVEDLA